MATTEITHQLRFNKQLFAEAGLKTRPNLQKKRRRRTWMPSWKWPTVDWDLDGDGVLTSPPGRLGGTEIVD